MAAATAILQVAYGKEYPQEKLDLLYGMCRDENWSAKRFMDTVKWIVKHKPFPDWKIADFFTAPLLKLHPRSWYYEQCHLGIKTKTYKIGEHFLYALATDDIPFPEFVYVPKYEVQCEEAPQAAPSEHAAILSGLTGTMAGAAGEII